MWYFYRSHEYAVIGRRWSFNAPWNNRNATQFRALCEKHKDTSPIEFWMAYVSSDEFSHISKCCKKLSTMFGGSLPTSVNLDFHQWTTSSQKTKPFEWRTFSKSKKGYTYSILTANVFKMRVQCKAKYLTKTCLRINC